MTTGAKTHIAFADISGLELTCPSCNATDSRTLEDVAYGGCACKSCDEILAPSDHEHGRALLGLVIALRQLQRLHPVGE